MGSIRIEVAILNRSEIITGYYLERQMIMYNFHISKHVPPKKAVQAEDCGTGDHRNSA